MPLLHKKLHYRHQTLNTSNFKGVNLWVAGPQEGDGIFFMDNTVLNDWCAFQLPFLCLKKNIQSVSMFQR